MGELARKNDAEMRSLQACNPMRSRLQLYALEAATLTLTLTLT